MKINSFEDLEVYQLSIQFTRDIYKIVKTLPFSEKFNIANQLIRAAASIGANIAEGFGRNSTKEFVKFLYIARGSLLETRHFLILAKELDYIEETDFARLRTKNDNLGVKLNNLIKSLSKKIS